MILTIYDVVIREILEYLQGHSLTSVRGLKELLVFVLSDSAYNYIIYQQLIQSGIIMVGGVGYTDTLKKIGAKSSWLLITQILAIIIILGEKDQYLRTLIDSLGVSIGSEVYNNFFIGYIAGMIPGPLPT